MSLSGQVYLVTTVVRNREPVFRDFGLARAAVRGMRIAAGEGRVRWLAWVLMPDHFHGLVALGEDRSLSMFTGRAKGCMAREVNRVRGNRGPFWQSIRIS